MKKLFIPIAAILLVACGGNEEVSTEEVKTEEVQKELNPLVKGVMW